MMIEARVEGGRRIEREYFGNYSRVREESNAPLVQECLTCLKHIQQHRNHILTAVSP